MVLGPGRRDLLGVLIVYKGDQVRVSEVEKYSAVDRAREHGRPRQREYLHMGRAQFIAEEGVEERFVMRTFDEQDDSCPSREAGSPHRRLISRAIWRQSA